MTSARSGKHLPSLKLRRGKQRRPARFRISRYTPNSIIWQARQSFEFGLFRFRYCFEFRASYFVFFVSRYAIRFALHEIAPLQLSRNLYKSALFYAKQSQFPKSQMDIKLDISRDYENISDWTLGQNKPNSNPNKANLHLTAENAEYAEKKDIFVSDCPIEKYALYPISPCSLRTWRLMKNKANSKPIKANAGSLGNLFDHIEIFVFKTKLKILILQDRLDILLINEALRLIR